MRHRHARIVFVERKSRDGRHRVSRDQLADEYHASFGRPPHIKPDVHFLERLVKRNREPEYARAVELETNQAEVGFAFEYVQFRAGGDEWFEQRGRNRIVEHQQILPLGGQKPVLMLHNTSLAPG